MSNDEPQTTCPDCKDEKQVGINVKEWCQTCDGEGKIKTTQTIAKDPLWEEIRKLPAMPCRCKHCGHIADNWLCINCGKKAA